MTRLANRRDSTHKPLTDAFKRLGWCVVDTSRVGDDFPDIVAAKRGVTALIEFKTPKGRRTKGQTDFAHNWPGLVYLCASLDDVVAVDRLCFRPEGS